MKVKELREEVLLRQLSTAYGSAAETGNDILERLLDPFLDSISGNVESADVVKIQTVGLGVSKTSLHEKFIL